MSKKIYTKLGRVNYKEKKLIKELEDFIVKKTAEDPSFTIEPATNYNELQNLYYKYCVEDVPYQDVKSGSKEKVETGDSGKSFPIDDDDDTFVDPMNREEPIVRDYVTNNEFGSSPNANPNTSNQTEFGEPMSFEESFQFPDDNATQNGGGGATSPNRVDKNNPKSDNKLKPTPINPDFDDMSNGRKKKSTKKFAKYIVSAVAMLQEKGFVWFATKDITEAKLMEYELSNEMDLSLLLSLEDGQEVTIKHFFRGQCDLAEQLAKIDQSKLDDLSDVLAEVMLEKGVAPTPQQELMLIGGSILAEQVLKMIAFNSQIKGVLSQLRNMNSESKQEPRPQPRPEPKYEPQPEPKQEPQPQESVAFVPTEKQPTEGDFDELELMILNNPIETKE
jgi:hypothetical protein